MKTAIVFLCKEINAETLAFSNEVAISKIGKVYLVSDETERLYAFDEMNTLIDSTFPASKIYVKDSICERDGYVGCNIDGNSTHIKKKVIAYDKFLWAFCNKLTSFDNVWVFEDDCFIPSVEALGLLNLEYSKADLVTANNIEKKDKIPDWHWAKIFDKIEAPYFHSMVCGAMFSSKMLKAIKEFVDKNKTLFHIEAMFNTLAAHHKLKIRVAKELKTIVWQGEWNLDHVVQRPNNIFHPIKDLAKHKELRKDLKTAITIGYMAKIKLPDFVI